MFILECRFSIQNTRRINVDSSEMEIFKHVDTTGYLISNEKDDNGERRKISLSKNLILKCDGIDTYDNAILLSNKIYLILYFFGCMYNVKITKETKNLQLSENMKKSLHPILESDAILIYKQTENTELTVPLIIKCEIDYYMSYNDDKLFIEKSFEKDLDQNNRNFNIVYRTVEIYNSTISEPDNSTKILNIIMSLEILTNVLDSSEKNRTDDEIEIIDYASNSLKQKYEKKEIDQIVSLIGNLKRKSIKDQIVLLISPIISDDEILNYNLEKFISECYRIRSAIVHGNNFSNINILKEHTFVTIIQELSKIAKKVIEHQFRSLIY